jgi:hypothetical protein
MSFNETRLPGLQTHVGDGAAYPYYVPFTQSQLVTPIPGLNVLPILPAGSLINIAGHLYRTIKPLEAGSPGPQIGAIVPLGPPRPSVIGPKDTSTFTDRADVYWDATANCFTATVGSNVKVGRAVSNPSLGSAVNGTGSSLNITPSTGATEYNAVASVTGGTSADGQVGAYAAGDAYMEVELIGT